MLQTGLKSNSLRSKRREEKRRAKNGNPSAAGSSANLVGPINLPEGRTLTRALRSHQLWLTVTYFCLLTLMARGFAS